MCATGLMHRAEVGEFGQLAITLFCCAWQSFQAPRAGSMSAQGCPCGAKRRHNSPMLISTRASGQWHTFRLFAGRFLTDYYPLALIVIRTSPYCCIVSW
jgi:hypothetical protein